MVADFLYSRVRVFVCSCVRGGVSELMIVLFSESLCSFDRSFICLMWCNAVSFGSASFEDSCQGVWLLKLKYSYREKQGMEKCFVVQISGIESDNSLVCEVEPGRVKAYMVPPSRGKRITPNLFCSWC